MMTRLFIILLICFSGFITKGQVRLPRIFADHMVIQQNQPIHIWGWASSGEKVSVTLNDQKATVSASKDGMDCVIKFTKSRRALCFNG
jgi:sialate O-acetylesterase